MVPRLRSYAKVSNLVAEEVPLRQPGGNAAVRLRFAEEGEVKRGWP